MDKSRVLAAIRAGSVDPFFEALYHKESPSQPAAPDYAGAAQATASGNIEAAQQAQQANLINQYTPYGSLTYTQDPWSKYSSGNPGYSATIALSPTGQALLDNQNNAALGLGTSINSALGRTQGAMAQPFNPNATPVQTGAGVNPNYATSVDSPRLATSYDTSGVAPIPTVDAQARQHAEDLAYQAATSRLDPQYAQAQAAQETQLRNQGLVPGGEAYDNAMRVFNQGKNDAYLQAQANAVNQGLTNQQAQFGMGLQANQAGFGQAQAQGQFGNNALTQQFGMGQQNAALQNQVGQQQFSQGLANANLNNSAAQQQIQQQAYLRSLPLNELNALRTGAQVTNPTFSNTPQQQTAAGANMLGAAQAQGQYNQGLYNAGVGQANAFNSGLFQIGAAALPVAFSDRRLKSNIARIGTHPLGIGVYEYDIFGRRERGVMADEVMKVMPEAVMKHPSGFYMVDYGRL